MHSIVSETSKCLVYGNGSNLLFHTLLIAGKSRNISFLYSQIVRTKNDGY